jgi:alkaline phosphatase D
MPVKILFGSCLHQDKPQPIWQAMNQEQADLFVLLGDNIYGDTENMVELKAKYAK